MQGDGVMSFHCTLPQGHDAPGVTLDATDPEPCYAVESGRSTRGWAAWSKREYDRRQALIAPLAQMGMVIDCPKCHEPEMKITADEGGTCGACGATAEIQQDLDTVASIGEPMLPGDGDVAAPAPADPERDADIREAAKAFSPAEVFASLRGAELEGEALGRALAEQHIAEARTAVWPKGPMGDGCTSEHEPATNPACVMRPAFEAAGFAEAPESLRQRPEDQTLPTGDESIPDDQSLVIDDIEARRKVGIQRYGQGHRPFNGRNTLLDAYEEALDGAVYLRSLLRARAAAKVDLIDAIAHTLEKISEEARYSYDIGPMAVALTDRVLDYVTLRIEEARALLEEAERAKVPAREQVADHLRSALRTGPHKMDEDGSWVSQSYVLDVLDEIGRMRDGGTYRIIAAREHQIAKGYNAEHDAEHGIGDVLEAAKSLIDDHAEQWPWGTESYPSAEDSPVDRLAKAGAMIAAAIDVIVQHNGETD